MKWVVFWWSLSIESVWHVDRILLGSLGCSSAGANADPGHDEKSQVQDGRGQWLAGRGSAQKGLAPKQAVSQPDSHIAKAANAVLGCTNKCVASWVQGAASMLGRAQVSLSWSVCFWVSYLRDISSGGTGPQKESSIFMVVVSFATVLCVLQVEWEEGRWEGIACCFPCLWGVKLVTCQTAVKVIWVTH